MNKVRFLTNRYAILFNSIENKIDMAADIHYNPERKAHYEKIGVKGSEWDKVLNKFIKENPAIFKNKKLVNISKGPERENVFRDLTSIASVSEREGKEVLGERIESRLKTVYQITDEEYEAMGNLMAKFDALIESPEFKKIHQLAYAYKKSLALNWEQNKDKILEYYESLVNGSNTKNSLTVYVLPPLSETNRVYTENSEESSLFYASESNLRKKDKNQDIINIATAAFKYAYVPAKYTMVGKAKKRLNAFSMFASTKELSHRFSEMSYIEGTIDPELAEEMSEMYPLWLGYLHRKDKNPVLGIKEDLVRDAYMFKLLKKDNAAVDRYYSAYDFENISPDSIATFFRDKKSFTPYQLIGLNKTDIDKSREDSQIR